MDKDCVLMLQASIANKYGQYKEADGSLIKVVEVNYESEIQNALAQFGLK